MRYSVFRYVPMPFGCLHFYDAFCQMLLLPLYKFHLPLLTRIESPNIRPNVASNGLDLMLWNGGVID